MVHTKTEKLPVIADPKEIVPRSSPLVARGLDLIKTIEHPLYRQSQEAEIIHRFIGHSDEVNCIAVSSDGKYILSGSEDKTARLWDSSSGKELLRLEGHTHSISSVAFSLDGRYAATGGEDKTIKVWSLIQKQELYSFDLAGDVVELRWFNAHSICCVLTNTQLIPSEYGEFLAELSEIDISDINIETIRLEQGGDGIERVLATIEQTDTIGFIDIVDNSFKYSIREHFGGTGDSIWTLSNDLSLALIYHSGAHTIQVRHTYTGAMFCEFSVDFNFINRAIFSPENSFLIVAGRKRWDREICLWDLKQNREFFRFTIQKQTDTISRPLPVQDLSISPDSRLALFVESNRFSVRPDTRISLWDLRTGQQLATLKGHSGFLKCVSFLPDCLHAVSGSQDRTILLYRLPRPRAY